jgi:hypothetical protein
MPAASVMAGAHQKRFGIDVRLTAITEEIHTGRTMLMHGCDDRTGDQMTRQVSIMASVKEPPATEKRSGGKTV